MLGGGQLAVIVVLFVWLLWPSAGTGGDPGGKVMGQLAPVATALPGYGTGAVPWVSEIPQSLTASYAIKMEPRQDSCDGMAGTQGWSQVVVQTGFQWSEGLPALVAYMNGRLATLGWSASAVPSPSNPSSTVIVPTGRWTKTLHHGSPAILSVTNEGGSHWQLVALAEPGGKAASGC
jgi:hypothetical protein